MFFLYDFCILWHEILYDGGIEHPVSMGRTKILHLHLNNITILHNLLQ